MLVAVNCDCMVYHTSGKLIGEKWSGNETRAEHMKNFAVSGGCICDTENCYAVNYPTIEVSSELF